MGYRISVLSHSAKGSEWKEHKYIAKKDGTYIYPEDKAVALSLKGYAGMKDADIQNLQNLYKTKGG